MTNPEPFRVPRLETTRLWLRPWKKADVAEYKAMVSDPEVMRYMGCGWRYRVKRKAFRLVSQVSDAGARWKIRHLMQHWQRCGFGEWAVEEKASGKLIGQFGLTHHPDWIVDDAKVEIGWLLARRAWGKGFATEGAKASLAYAFEQLKLERIVSISHADNMRSLNVMRRIGLAAGGKTHWNGCDVVWSAMDRGAWERSLVPAGVDGKKLFQPRKCAESREIRS